MNKVHAYTVTPSLPEKLSSLMDLVYNLRWCWDHASIDLLRRLDRQLWEKVNHNPVVLLQSLDQQRLESLVEDDGFMAQLERVSRQLEWYMNQHSWFEKTQGETENFRVAYFSAEFGLTECLPVYSGGLGVLAGDHLKSASELGIPLVGVGLLYQQGYFRQYLNEEGWQQELYPENNFYDLPVRPEKDAAGNDVLVDVDFPGRKVFAKIWRIQVGRVPLYLLDTNIPENAEPDRDITDQLYGGDLETRIKQEVLLGIGGLRALHALGIPPTVCHMNEGHSAFLALERIRRIMEATGASFEEAREAARGGTIFTTHTPVPAGIDNFPPALIDRYFGDFWGKLHLTRDQFLALGRRRPGPSDDTFNMAILALGMADHTNGVSELHGMESRRMWKDLWPEIPENEVPITSVTNGIHVRSWISIDMAGIFDRYLGPRWITQPGNHAIWKRVDQIPDEELWRTHERRRERLVAFARRRLTEQAVRRGASSQAMKAAQEALDPDILTIGFSRRFASYKRATLLLRDPERLKKILLDAQRPVQILFAGKAHPRDLEGKDLIRQIIQFARTGDVRHRVVFLEDYDIVTARTMVQGVDVWLNTPRRLMEASGTSGMKAAVNGALNLSILDGWWCEGYNLEAENGWAIGKDEVYEDLNYQDTVEANAIYTMLETEIAPLFYDRGSDKLPRKWIARMKASMRSITPVFNTNRMVWEYAERFYLPLSKRFQALAADGMAMARELAAWKTKVRQEWGRIWIADVQTQDGRDLKVGTKMTVTARVYLAGLAVEDVAVQLYAGPLNTKREIIDAEALPMRHVGAEGDKHLFQGVIDCASSGVQGYTVRVVPYHRHLNEPLQLGLIFWEK
jgi:starch phosphorylase